MGSRLFPDKDPNKWNKAVAALEEFIKFADEEGNYELLNTGNPSQDIYDLFQTYNKEIIWATAATSWGGMTNDMFDRRCTPRSEQNGMGWHWCHTRTRRRLLYEGRSPGTSNKLFTTIHIIYNRRV